MTDQEAREAIRNRLDVTMLVEAAAGTGKTTSLVARMVNLVAADLDPELRELDEPAAKQITEEFWNRWYDEQNFGGNPLLAEAREVGLDRKTLRGAFARVVEYPDVTLISKRSPRPDLQRVV